MDGWVVIGTELDTKQLEKDIKNAERELKRYESESEKLTKRKAKLEIDISDGEREIEIFNNKIEKMYDNLQKEKQKLADIPVWYQEGPQYEKQIQKVDTLNAKYSEMLIKQDGMRLKLDRASGELDGINLKIKENAKNQGLVNTKIDDMNGKLRRTKGLDNIKDSIDGIGKSLNNTIKKVSGWALALIGVQTVYSAIRSAMGILSQYDEQLATNIEYIKFALANTLKPVIEYLVNLAFKLLTYVNYIAKAWFGVNLFANSSAKAFKGAKDGLSKTNKEAQKLNKTLASFDEMNILQDTSQKDTTTDGGGALMPDVDLKSLDAPIPKWLEWIKDHGQEIIALISGIAVALGLMNMGLSPKTAIGLGIAIGGVVYAIEGLIDYLKDPSFENFGKVIQGIAIAVVGLGIVFGSLPAIIIGAILLIVATIIRYWDEIKGKIEEWITYLESKASGIRQKFGDFIGGLYEIGISTMKTMLSFFDDVFKGLKQILDGIIQFVKGVFTGNWKQAWEGVLNIFKGIWNILVSTVKTTMTIIINTISVIATTVGTVIGAAFKMVINGVLAAIENILNSPIRQINKLLNIINKVPGINIRTLNTFDLPRLAKGGIVNYPGPGVPIGGAIAGERGQEGVIPLTDSQQMALLGEAIGKYITINAQITNTMNGRVISRELQKVQNTSDFAFNR